MKISGRSIINHRRVLLGLTLVIMGLLLATAAFADAEILDVLHAWNDDTNNGPGWTSGNAQYNLDARLRHSTSV